MKIPKHILSLAVGFVLGAAVFSFAPSLAADVEASRSTDKVAVNGITMSAEAYKIAGSNYFKLRDMAKIANIAVWYDEDTHTVNIEAGKPYDPNYTGPAKSESE